MKTNLLLTLAAAATLLTACNNENETDTTWNGEIRLSSGVTVQQTRANSADVPDSQIAGTQTVQVVVTKQATDDKTYAGYAQALTADGNGNFTGGSTMYYPESGKGVNIYAYHPASASASFVTNADQSTDTNYFNSDLLYSAATDYARQSAAHPLTFKHKLSKLTYTLVAGTGTPTITGATVKWKNVCNTIGFTAATGVLGSSATNPVAITPHATYGAIIVPQTVAASTPLLEVTLANGGKLTYTPTANQVFDTEKSYNYKIIVNLSGLEVTSLITPWTAVGERTGDAEM